MRKRSLLLLGGWAFLVLGTLLTRPVLPIDETRYIAVAWESWWRHSIAVPYLNGAYYDGKPPLLFWLMQLGWEIFGLSDWWARLVSPLFGLANLYLTAGIARTVWPGMGVDRLAPWLLLGALYWAVFSSATMFDMLLASCTLVAVWALLRVWRGGGRRYFLLAGLGLGLGILAKGPVLFIPVMAVGLTAPWWMLDSRPEGLGWRRWYAGLGQATLVAGGVALLWLVPMGLGSGRDYLHDMLWQQTAGYAVESFSHRRPIWWYLPILPVLLLPWPLWPEAWKAGARVRALAQEPGVRLSLAWAGIVFVIVTLISAKQAHYLLPMFPPLALLLARVLIGHEPPATRFNAAGLPYLLLGGAWLASIPLHDRVARLDPWVAGHDPGVSLLAGLAMVALGLLVALGLRRLSLAARVQAMAASTWVCLLVTTAALMRISHPAYDVRPASAFLGELARQGAPLAIHESSYHGQFTFYGRLRHPIDLTPADEPRQWSKAHPDGYVISEYDASAWPPARQPAPVYRQPYRGKVLGVWRASDISNHPELLTYFR